MICSREPDGMIRASTTSAPSSSVPRLRSPGAGPMLATSPSYGSTDAWCPRSAAARSSCCVCQPVRAARTASCTLLRLHRNESVETASGELAKIVGDLLEARRGDTFLQRVGRGEIELRLAIAGRGRAVEVRFELGELGSLEADFALIGRDQWEVSVGIILLEGGSILGRFVDHGD